MQLPILPELVAISETKLINNSSNKHLVNIENYNFSHDDSLSQAEGVGMFIKKDLSFRINKDLHIDTNSCESLFVEILSNRMNNRKQPRKNTIVWVIYRHPGFSYATFQDKFGKMIQKLKYSNSPFLLVDDSNIDVSKQNARAETYLNDVNSVGYCSLFNIPTRRPTYYSHICNIGSCLY